jgi:glycerol-3-phosphate acyltransferase PlsX
MRIGIDVMGGDHAPDAILEGALASLGNLSSDDEMVLVGDRDIIRSALRGAGEGAAKVTVAETTQVIGMADPPVEAVRTKPDSSLAVLARMAGRKADPRLDIVVSAGNTGAFISAAQMHMRRLPNVHRPGIAVPVPTFSGPVVIIDVGANIEPKPHHLSQYGVMGDVFARRILGVERPRIALMNVGGEEQKGTVEMRDARDRLRARTDIDFVGYIEGRAVFDGEADVVITDGVVGNVMIKLAEGLSAGIFRAIGREVYKIDPELAARFEPVVKRLYAEHDYHEYGGAPLLGVNGVCIISHGSSVARTITNAVDYGRRLVERDVNRAISEKLGACDEVLS